MIKKCSKCDIEKPIEQFSKNKEKKYGHASVCKECHSIYRREHYEKNKIKVLEQVRQYKIENPEKYTHKLFNAKNKKSGKTCETKCCVCGELNYTKKKHIEEKRKLYCSVDCKNKNNKSGRENNIFLPHMPSDK